MGAMDTQLVGSPSLWPEGHTGVTVGFTKQLTDGHCSLAMLIVHALVRPVQRVGVER